MSKSICEIDKDGDKRWYLNGQLHREDGPAIEHINGDKFWYLNGKRHREDGPACEYAYGDKEWYLNDKLHREDGPAYKGASGYREWHYYGKKLNCKTNKEFLRLIKLKAFW
jgi:hypothetical protein